MHFCSIKKILTSKSKRECLKVSLKSLEILEIQQEVLTVALHTAAHNLTTHL